MWSVRIATICRACLIEGSEDLVDFNCNIFVQDFFDVKYKVANCFEEISNIVVTMDEMRSSKLCQDCYKDLQVAMRFKGRSNESNRRILLEIENESMQDDDGEFMILNFKSQTNLKYLLQDEKCHL